MMYTEHKEKGINKLQNLQKDVYSDEVDDFEIIELLEPLDNQEELDKQFLVAYLNNQ